MRTLLISLLVLITSTFQSNAQLANGSTAPDFTLTDLNGNSHNLYSYLAEGKTVFIEFFACHCPSCWAYHNTHRLRDLYDTYGPNGSNEIMVIMLEHDEYNADAFTGDGGWTAGDWTADNSVPMCDVEGEDRSVFDDYQMAYYPYIVKVCPDKITENISPSLTTEDLYQKAVDCPGQLNLEETSTPSIDINVVNKQLMISTSAEQASVTILNTTGQTVVATQSITSDAIDLSFVESGIYFVNVSAGDQVITKRIYI